MLSLAASADDGAARTVSAMTRTTTQAARTSGPDLAATISAALEAADSLHPGDRLGRLVFAVEVPRAPASSMKTTRELLVRRGGVVLGSAGAATGANPSLFVAADIGAWESAVTWFLKHPLPRSIVGFSLARARVRVHDETERVWSATLHPDTVGSGPAAMVPASPGQVDAFEAAVTRAGGTLRRDYLRSGTLTYAAVELPDVAAAQKLASFNALRSLETVTRISFR